MIYPMNKKTDDTPGSYSTLDPLTFEADHHTDLWIARRVMEWPEIKEKEQISDYFHFGGVIIGGDRPIFFRYGTIPDMFQPSSRMEDALQVLRKMKEKGWYYNIRGGPKKPLTVSFLKLFEVPFSAQAESEPLAICRAAGLAVMNEEK